MNSPATERETLKDISTQIEATGKSRTVTVRDLLSKIGQVRRGKHVAKTLRRELKRARLKVDPDFENVHIDAVVTLSLGPKLGRPTRIRDSSYARDSSISTDPSPRNDSGAPATNLNEAIDSTFTEDREVVVTVRQGIPAAGKPPTIIRRNESSERALTMMLNSNIGQLVVVQGERKRVEGIFTWRSYCQQLLSGSKCEFVEDCLSNDFAEVNEERPLFDAVREVIRHGIVIVRARDNSICGLVTSVDVSEVFIELAEPFLFLGQIENHLRELVRKMKLSEVELRSLVDIRDVARARNPAAVENFTLGELVRAVENPDNWKRIGIRYDRKILIERLSNVRRIRNNVMHFDVDGITKAERDYLEETRRILQEVDRPLSKRAHKNS